MEEMVYFMPNEEILVFTYIAQKACRCFPEVKEYVWIWFQFSSVQLLSHVQLFVTP